MKRKFFSVKPFSFVAPILFFLLFSSCKSKTTPYEPTYSVNTSKKTLLYGVPTQAYYKMYTPFVNYLNAHLPNDHIQIVSSSDFTAYIDKVNQGVFELAIANGVIVLDSTCKGYDLAGETVAEEGNAGVILVNKDSSINKFSDLKGKLIAVLPSPALQGNMLQMVYLAKKGIDVNKEIKLKYLESFESIILNVYLGKCSAGFSSTTNWRVFVKRRPEIASKVNVKWITAATPGNTLLIRKNVNEKTVRQLKDLILTMHQNDEGKTALAELGYVKFIPADSNTYLPLKNFLKDYKKLIVDH